MAEPRIAPGAFRRRLALAFVLTLGLLTAGLHTAAYVIVREALLDDSAERTLPQARFAVGLTTERLPADPGDDDLNEVVADFQRRTRFDAVLVHDEQTYPSAPTVDLDDVPEDLVTQVRAGEVDENGLAKARTTLQGSPHLVFGSVLEEEDAELYLFFSQKRVWDNIGDVRRVLAFSWLVVVMVAALIASLFARRVLQPVARAGAAARSLAEGLLDTRLPVDTSDEFGVWAHSFNQMADALQGKILDLREARDRERRFTADVSHELKTPLTALTGAASMLADQIEDLPPDARRPAELLVSDVRRLRVLVDDLMEISRLDAGEGSVAPMSFDVSSQLRSLLRDRGWSEKVAVRGSDGRVHTDPRRYERIVANLIENAIEHAGEPVEIEFHSSGGDLVLEVRDRGPGVPADHLPRIFDRFYKVDPARTSPGSGLGLAIARENARLLGGDIEVESGPQGATFVVRISRDVSGSEA